MARKAKQNAATFKFVQVRIPRFIAEWASELAEFGDPEMPDVSRFGSGRLSRSRVIAQAALIGLRRMDKAGDFSPFTTGRMIRGKANPPIPDAKTLIRGATNHEIRLNAFALLGVAEQLLARVGEDDAENHVIDAMLIL